jgi:hypothetical protein
MSVDTFKKVIENNSLRLTPPSEFNDPFDSLAPAFGKGYVDVRKNLIDFLQEEFSKDKNEVEKIVQKVEALAGKPVYGCDINCSRTGTSFPRPLNSLNKCLQRLETDFCTEMNQRKYEKELKNIRVISFSTDSEGNGEPCRKNILMWSHYGDQHKGVLCKFKFPLEISDYIRQVQYIEMNKPLKHIDDIIKRKFYSIKESHKGELTCEAFLNYFIVCSSDMTEIEIRAKNPFLYHKNKCWDYENEWRFIQSIDKLKEDYPDALVRKIDMDFLEFDLNCIKDVVFGYKMQLEDIRKIKSFLGVKTGCKFSRARKTKFNQIVVRKC